MFLNPKLGLPASLCTAAAAAAHHHLHRPSAFNNPRLPPATPPLTDAGLRFRCFDITVYQIQLEKPFRSPVQIRIWSGAIDSARGHQRRGPNPLEDPPDASDFFSPDPAVIASAPIFGIKVPEFSGCKTAAVSLIWPELSYFGDTDVKDSLAEPPGLQIRRSSEVPGDGIAELEEAAAILPGFGLLGLYGKRSILVPVPLEKMNYEPWGFLAPIVSSWGRLTPAFSQQNGKRRRGAAKTKTTEDAENGALGRA